ncbi:MAG: TolC family protein [Bacteroidales bacterium]|nr:TolC family protein [Bacteroidales bacterium]
MTIQEMFARADSLNTSIQAARLGVESARAAEAVARNGYLPSIDASLSFSYNGNGYIMERNFTNGFKVDIPHFGNNFKLQASQVVYAGGAIKHGVELAKSGTELARFQADKNRGEVRFLIAGDYIELCKLGNQLQVLDSNLELTRKLIDKMQARVENGAALRHQLAGLCDVVALYPEPHLCGAIRRAVRVVGIALYPCGFAGGYALPCVRPLGHVSPAPSVH